jgi:type IV secretory pathway VirB10-like protein
MPKIKELLKFQSSKTRNLFILIIVLIVTVLLFGIYWSSRSTQTDMAVAKMPKAPAGLAFAPGTQKVSKEYLQTLLESERLTAAQALQKGQSAMPAIIDRGNATEATGKELTSGSEQGGCYNSCVKCCQGGSTTGMLNDWVKKGLIPAEAAASLSKLQDKNVSVSEYAAELNRLVRSGQLTPEQAKALLASYQKEHTEETKVTSTNLSNDLVSTGAIDPEVASQLKALRDHHVSIEEYSAALDRLVKEGKLTAEQAKQLLEAYKAELAAMGLGISSEVAKVEQPYDQVVSQLKNAGKLSPEVVDDLNRAKGMMAADYASQLTQLVKEAKVAPESARQLLGAYRQQYGDTHITTTDKQLAALQANQQQQMLRHQEDNLRQEQMRIQADQQKMAMDLQEKKIQLLQGAMQKQAAALLTSWEASPQTFVFSANKDNKKGEKQAGQEGTTGDQAGTEQAAAASNEGKTVLIKAGTIMFAVLDTSVNSDQPGPIMATLVAGPLKGGKLMGELSVTPDNERVMLKFNMLSMPDWPDVVKIDSVAINPDTARTAIASDVDHHYLLRYGSLFASNFIAGYASAVKSSGSTQTTKSNGDEETKHPDMSPSSKLLVALGAVGEKLNETWKDVFNKKPTIVVDEGVGLGILFVTSVYH